MKWVVRFFSYLITEAASKTMHSGATHPHAPEQHVHGHVGHWFALFFIEDVFTSGEGLDGSQNFQGSVAQRNAVFKLGFSCAWQESSKVAFQNRTLTTPHLLLHRFEMRKV